MTPHIIREENAAKIADWLSERGGIAIWNSINLGNPGASWTTPAFTAEGAPTSKPDWQADSQPARIITNAAEIIVSRDVEVCRFRVGIRRSSNGLSLKVTDGGTRRIRAAVIREGDGAYHIFDYERQEAVIFRPASQVSLDVWLFERSLLMEEIAYA